LNKSISKFLNNFELKFGKKLEHAIVSSNDLRIFPKFCEEYDSQLDISEFSCNLKTLYFDHNKLVKIKMMDFMLLEKLEYLNFDSNDITMIEDNSFYNLESLETLILSKNNFNLANNPQALFNSLTNIKFMILSFNFIEFIRVNTFSNLLKLEVLDLSKNKIHSIKENSFNGLINLRDLYINENDRDLKLENSSFIRFESIKTIFLDKSVLNDSFHKSIFIEMVKNKNVNQNKTILKWIYFQVFNLITLNESFYDCGLVFELISYNIQYNLKTELDFNDYLSNCQSKFLKRKD
jgi:Leucine-rich repeat (LRR) protein